MVGLMKVYTTKPKFLINFPQLQKVEAKVEAKVEVKAVVKKVVPRDPVKTTIEMEAKVAKAVEQGAKVLCGGHRVGDKGYFYAATLLDNCTQDMDIIHEETFGPVLPIVEFEDIDQVIAWANDVEYGLASSVFTKDIDTAAKVTRSLEFGETYINREHFEAIQGFHAGVKKSGIGGADGKHGVEEYLRTHVTYLQTK